MNLTGTLRTTFSTAKPLDGSSMNPTAGPTPVVYRNGAVHVPAVAPVVANLAVGQYTLTHAFTVANGYAINDWVSITVQCTLDGLVVELPVFEGALVTAACDVVCLLNQTIYPLFTTHQPSTGANQNLDAAALPAITVYRNQVATAIAAVPTNLGTGVWCAPLPLTGATGWAAGDVVDIEAAGTIDGIAKTGFIFTGGEVVASVGGGGVPKHEILGHQLRFQ